MNYKLVMRQLEIEEEYERRYLEQKQEAEASESTSKNQHGR